MELIDRIPGCIALSLAWFLQFAMPVRAADFAHELKICRYVHTALDETTADKILADASDVLQKNHCALELRRSGCVTTFTTGNGAINSKGDYQKLQKGKGCIAVLDEIGWCGFPRADGFLGCSQPGGPVVVVRDAQVAEGILWLHEFGHAQGLRHRNANDAVMNGTIRPSHTAIVAYECDAFKKDATHTPSSPRANSTAATDGDTTSKKSDDAEPKTATSIMEFVRRQYIHGLPWDRAREFSEDEVVNALPSLLSNPGESQFWPNVVAALGAAGGRRAMKPLMKFFREGEGKLSKAAYRAKKAVPMYIGLIANADGEARDEAISFISIGATQPTAWIKQNEIRWNSPYADDRSTERRDFDLRLSCIWGLAYSGLPEAKETLAHLRKTENVSQVVDEALAIRDSVEKEGLIAFYQKAHHH